MSRRLVLRKDQFAVHTGETEYEVALPKGDCQVDYTIMADGEVSLYAGFEGQVVPIDHGIKLNGMLLIKDAAWLYIRPNRKQTMVAIQVFHTQRRLVDENDGKPLAVHVATPPAVDLQAMMRRVVGGPVEGLEDYAATAEDLQDQFPDDVDTEFGPGYVQLEEDEDIVDALRTREENLRSRKKGSDPGEDGEGEKVERKPERAGSGRKPQKRAATPPEEQIEE